MSTPKRIQRRRTRGWRMPEGAVCVSRPSKYGNPFVWKKVTVRPDSPFPEARSGRVRASHSDAAHAFGLWVDGRLPDWARGMFVPIPPPCPPWTLEELRRDLAGKDLACWCPLDRSCHADILLEKANAEKQA